MADVIDLLSARALRPPPLTHSNRCDMQPCASCKRAIDKGEKYFDVRQPDGTTQPVHETCMGPTR